MTADRPPKPLPPQPDFGSDCITEDVVRILGRLGNLNFRQRQDLINALAGTRRQRRDARRRGYAGDSVVCSLLAAEKAIQECPTCGHTAHGCIGCQAPHPHSAILSSKPLLCMCTGEGPVLSPRPSREPAEVEQTQALHWPLPTDGPGWVIQLRQSPVVPAGQAWLMADGKPVGAITGLGSYLAAFPSTKSERPPRAAPRTARGTEEAPTSAESQVKDGAPEDKPPVTTRAARGRKP